MASHDKNYYIFRVSYDKKELPTLIKEMDDGRLRQGWSSHDDQDLSKEDMDLFKEAWIEEYGDDDYDEAYVERRFRNLSIMLEFEPGDVIIVPKVPENREFQIFKVSERYYYQDVEEVPTELGPDKRSVVGVEPISTFAYNNNEASITVSSSFTGYRSAINRVLKEENRKAIEELLEKDPGIYTDKNKALDVLDVWGNPDFDELAKNINERLNDMGPNDLEMIISTMFERNGYFVESRNRYDGKSKDVDLHIVPSANTLLSDILGLDEGGRRPPQIYIQAKNKSGVYKDAGEAIDQLKDFKIDGDHEEGDIYRIVITTATEISDEAIEKARKERITIIDGPTFSKLLILYGANVISEGE